ncbi:MAG TPA: PAS domain S-box protein, partial [Rectinemataceae bacterium]|nr:PAS domain S-box protein [Rectinemataceae bacterium]
LLSRAKRSPIRLTMGVATGLYTLVMIARAVIALKDNSFGLFTPSVVQYLAFLPQYIVLIVGTIGFMLLVKERDDERLRESEEKYRSVAERANEAIVIIQDGFIVFANRRAAEMVSAPSSSALVGGNIDRWVFGEDLERVKERQRARLAGEGLPPSEEFRLVSADGAISWVSSSASVIPYRGRPATLALLADIGEHKRQQERIEKLLAEKELLLREVNHRVKNNLGVAISLLSLQAGGAGNSRAEAILTEAQARLTTMAELYESLHRAGSSGVLSIRDYLPSLTKEVAQLFPREPAVRFALDLDDIELGAELLSPLGIILNEIMTNSLKHAFDGTKTPLISLSGTMRDGRVVIRCGDNGKGLPPDFDPENSKGFGASLISALLRQLGASWRIDREGGTAWELEFPPSLSPR